LADLQNGASKGGASPYPDLPDNVEHIYVSVKNTWQDAENLDDVHGYKSYIWIPEETFQVRIMKLHVYAEKFRAHSRAAASGGGHTSSYEAGAASGSHTHVIATKTEDRLTGWADAHQHSYFDVMPDYLFGAGLHTHPDHAHLVYDHTHPIDFGIYEEDIAGRTLSAKLYDPDGVLLKDFGVVTTGEADVILDLSPYFETLKYGMYYLELTASARLRARLVFYELCLMYAY